MGKEQNNHFIIQHVSKRVVGDYLMDFRAIRELVETHADIFDKAILIVDILVKLILYAGF